MGGAYVRPHQSGRAIRGSAANRSGRAGEKARLRKSLGRATVVARVKSDDRVAQALLPAKTNQEQRADAGISRARVHAPHNPCFVLALCFFSVDLFSPNFTRARLRPESSRAN